MVLYCFIRELYLKTIFEITSAHPAELHIYFVAILHFQPEILSKVTHVRLEICAD